MSVVWKARSSAVNMMALALLLLATAPTAAALDVDLWQGGVSDGNSDVMSLKQTPFEDYWEQLPSLGSEKGSLQVQGYSFQGRMALYRYIMFEIDPAALWETPKHTTKTSSLREYHWLWAFGAQLDWQHRSGRLHDNDDESNGDQISTTGWFGYMNFGFSVAILLGLEQSGMITEKVDLDPVSKQLMETDTGMQQVVAGWSDFFGNGYRNYKEAMLSANATTPVDVDAERFQLQKALWKAHVAVIDNLIDGPQSQELLAQMPAAERDFGRGWARMVEILAACVFPTDLVTLRKDGAGYLPTVVLTDDAWANQLARFENDSTNSTGSDDMQPQSYAEKRRVTTVESTHKLVGMPDSSLKKMVQFWKRVVRSYRVSRTMPDTIVKLFHGSPLVKAGQLGRVLWLFVGAREWLAIAIGAAGAPAVWRAYHKS